MGDEGVGFSVQGKQHGWVATCSKTCPGEACSIFMLSCLLLLFFFGGEVG